MITARYHFVDGSPYIARYASCKCPIAENLLLPERKKRKDYAFFHYCDRSNKGCSATEGFKPVIDIREDGYHQ